MTRSWERRTALGVGAQASSAWPGARLGGKNKAENFEAAKASHKSKNRLETKHFKTISGRGRRLRFSAEKPRRLQQSPGLLPRAAFRSPCSNMPTRMPPVRAAFLLAVSHQMVPEEGYLREKGF
ncbi:MAG: hypothetical protein IJ594_07340 [Oscillospiraceae bacterium]|nr:hypothetical protein [Oscillospiraceae bacterium]